MVKRVAIANNSLGWQGGDRYLSNLRIAIEELQSFGVVEISDPESSRYLSSFIARFSPRIAELYRHHRHSRDSVNLPWPLTNRLRNPLYWVPDLQDVELPAMFSMEEIDLRRKLIEKRINKNAVFYFSSKHAESVFLDTYLEAKSVGVVRFAVVKSEQVMPISMLEKCKVCRSGNFIYLPNQWWKHKNHMIALKALKTLGFAENSVHLVMTGSQIDYRWPDYENIVLDEISANHHNVHNLGYVTEAEQAYLYNNCAVVLQPSLYEGWSTSIEEAVLYSRKIIASDLPSNIEQLVDYPNAVFFQKNEEESLQSALIKSLEMNTFEYHYAPRWNRFIADLQSVLNRLD
jgi:glycosyltransferase involved in cell wall biosynthesis